MKDYYKILGISKDATDDDIKKAYRKLAHQYHPDKKGGDGSKFKEISEAYQVLSNKEKRLQYDRFGTAEPFFGAPGFGAEGPFAGFDFGGFDPEDLGNFGEFFEAFFEGLGVRSKTRTYRRGLDLEILETITLEEAFRGISKKLDIDTLVVCGECAGNGHDVKAGLKECVTCAGRGKIQESGRTFFGSFSQVKSCPQCFGVGKVPNKICGRCFGAGRIKGRRTVSFDILPGVNDEQIIKIKGSGEAGERSAEAGDLYVRIKIKPHPVFKRNGENLYLKKSVNVIDALLGHKIEVLGIDGKKLQVVIPPGFNFREDLRIPGEGMPRLNVSIRGDLFISFELIMPKKLSSKARDLLLDLRGEL